VAAVHPVVILELRHPDEREGAVGEEQAWQ
jgi:hypothetical protein